MNIAKRNPIYYASSVIDLTTKDSKMELDSLANEPDRKEQAYHLGRIYGYICGLKYTPSYIVAKERLIFGKELGDLDLYIIATMETVDEDPEIHIAVIYAIDKEKKNRNIFVIVPKKVYTAVTSAEWNKNNKESITDMPEKPIICDKMFKLIMYNLTTSHIVKKVNIDYVYFGGLNGMSNIEKVAEIMKHDKIYTDEDFKLIQENYKI